jgi:hypothetical protein
MTIQHTSIHITYTPNTHITQNSISKKQTNNNQKISSQSYANNEGHITANEYSIEKEKK